MDWLLSAEGLAIVRRAYARQMLGIGNIRNDRLELAFATIRREHFLGPEPWQIVQWPPGPLLPANDPVYVYQDVVLALAPLPFTVRWIDGRSDQFPPHVPQNAVTVCTDDVGHELAQAPRDAMVVVMTHSHPLDFDITAAALQRDAFDFVGLIGSETKRARFSTWARQLAIAEEKIDRLVCPIGLPQIRGKEPAVIAAGIAAQLLMVRERASAPPLASPATQPA